MTQQRLSFLGAVDEAPSIANAKRRFLIVYISTVSVIQHGFDRDGGGVKRSKLTPLFAEADTIISISLASS